MTPKKRAIRPGFEMLEDRCVPATFTVTKLADAVGVPGQTLREAVLKSNSSGAKDTIVFKPGLKGTIKLGSQIAITDDVKIDGPGAHRLAISGQNATRIFSIDDGDPAVSSMKATIRNLTLTRGRASGGGAIDNPNDDLTLSKCTLSNSSAVVHGGAYQGGAGRLTIDRCQFVGNTAINFDGGAVRTSGILVVRNSRFAGNAAEAGGGAIDAHGDLADFRGCVFAGNTSRSGQGGALYLSNGAFTISQCTFAGNIARGDGGAIHLRGASARATISASTVAGNFADDSGGGIYCEGDADLTLRNCTVSGNAAAGDGGGLHVSTGAGSQSIEFSTVVYNTAFGHGDGIFIDSDIALSNTIVARNCSAAGGQDVYSFNLASDIFVARFCLIENDAAGFANILETVAGSNIYDKDPLLGPLQNNGGPTQTHALLAGSPAVNAAAPAPTGETSDQRGAKFKRVRGGRADIGAFER